jgi:hypothetical protein
MIICGVCDSSATDDNVGQCASRYGSVEQCRELSEHYGGLATLHEGSEDNLIGFQDLDAQHDMPDMPSAQFERFGLKETYTWSQSQQDPTQGITEETVAVLEALRNMQGAMHGFDESSDDQINRKLSYFTCTAGLGREEVSKVFYQLLGTYLARRSQ